MTGKELGVQGLEPWTRGLKGREASDTSADDTGTSETAESSTASSTEKPDLQALAQALAALSDDDRQQLMELLGNPDGPTH